MTFNNTLIKNKKITKGIFGVETPSINPTAPFAQVPTNIGTGAIPSPNMVTVEPSEAQFFTSWSKMFPGKDLETSYNKLLQNDDAEVTNFITTLRTSGKNADTESLLNSMFPGISPEQINELFMSTDDYYWNQYQNTIKNERINFELTKKQRTTGYGGRPPQQENAPTKGFGKFLTGITEANRLESGKQLLPKDMPFMERVVRSLPYSGKTLQDLGTVAKNMVLPDWEQMSEEERTAFFVSMGLSDAISPISKAFNSFGRITSNIAIPLIEKQGLKTGLKEGFATIFQESTGMTMGDALNKALDIKIGNWQVDRWVASQGRTPAGKISQQIRDIIVGDRQWLVQQATDSMLTRMGRKPNASPKEMLNIIDDVASDTLTAIQNRILPQGTQTGAMKFGGLPIEPVGGKPEIQNFSYNTKLEVETKVDVLKRQGYNVSDIEFKDGQYRITVESKTLTKPTTMAKESTVTNTKWYRGTIKQDVTGQDLFFSSDPSVAGDYGTSKVGAKAKVNQLSPSEMPKKVYTTGSKEDIATELGITVDPYATGQGHEFDRLVKEKLQIQGYDAVHYKSGTLDAEELHIFGKQEATVPPQMTESTSVQTGLEGFGKESAQVEMFGEVSGKESGTVPLTNVPNKVITPKEQKELKLLYIRKEELEKAISQAPSEFQKKGKTTANDTEKMAEVRSYQMEKPKGTVFEQTQVGKQGINRFDVDSELSAVNDRIESIENPILPIDTGNVVSPKLTQQHTDIILGKFGQYLQGKDVVSLRELTIELRKIERSKRFQAYSTRAQQIYSETGNAEQAMKQATEELKGELPNTVTDDLDGITDTIRDAMFTKVYQVLADVW
jgi:hypothetical protein